jgi:GAF domain-containing protein
MDSADVQQGLTVDLVKRFTIGVAGVHEAYADIGGMCSFTEVSEYLHGVGALPALQRDLVSHAVNEALTDPYPRSPGLRAPYTAASIATAAGHGPGRFDSDVLEERLRYRTPRTTPLFRDDEMSRVASAQAANLLAAEHAHGLKRVTRLAREHFGTFASAVNLITVDRQLTPAVTGLPLSETSRGMAICNETIRFDTTLVVPDTLDDPRFSTNPFVTGEPHIRFYAGHPIQGPGGYRIGALCILDDTPRHFTPGDERKLRTLAALVHLELTQ